MGKEMKIVAVDDEQGALKMLVKAITTVKPEAELYSFSKPSEAISFASDNRVDVLFTDIHMRGTSGIDLAEKIQSIHPNVNIIFTTGYSEYAIDAINLRTSGYLLKPITAMAVEKELGNLRNLVDNTIKQKAVFVKTFGNFDVFHNGKIVAFRKMKAKELLAYLVDRRGSSVTRKEIASILYEDNEYTRSMQSNITQIIKNLKESLSAEGLENMLVIDNNSYSIDTKCFDCDAYIYEADKKNSLYKCNGEYMSQYSWAELSPLNSLCELMGLEQ